MSCALALWALATAAVTSPDPALLEFLGEWDDGADGVLDWEMLQAEAAERGGSGQATDEEVDDGAR